MGTKRASAVIALVVGLAMIITAVILWRGNRAAPTDAGALNPADADPVAATSAAPLPKEPPISAPRRTSSGTPKQPTETSIIHNVTSTPHATPSSKSAGTTPRPASTSADAAPTSVAIDPPAQLSIPSLDVTAQVQRVNSVAGVLQVPDDISRVGWWQHSATPGAATGTTVIDGHIDSAAAGEGALFHLQDLQPGASIAVRTQSGRTVRYQVQARRVYVKSQGLPAELFTQQGPGRLVVISCGGTFDATIHSYEENIAIFADPIT